VKQQEYNQASLQKLETELDNIQAELSSLNGELELSRQRLSNRRSEFNASKEKLPSFFSSPFEHIVSRKLIETEETLYEEALQGYETLAKKVDTKEGTKRLKEVEIESAKGKVSSSYVAFKRTLLNYADKVLIIFILVLIGPISWKAFWFFVISNIFKISKPIQIGRQSEIKHDEWIESEKTPEKTICLNLSKSDKLVVKPEWIQEYPSNISKKTKFFWKNNSPFLCYASGLVEMTEFSFKKEEEEKIDNDNSENKIVLGCNSDSQNYITAVTISNGTSITLKPSYIVGFIGNFDVETHWHLWSLHGWILGKLRTISFVGEGTILISGYGGIKPIIPTKTPIIIEEPMIIGYDSNVTYSIQRTETFWSFFNRKSSLFDCKFAGNGLIIKQMAYSTKYRDSENLIMKTTDGLLRGIGKILGF